MKKVLAIILVLVSLCGFASASSFTESLCAHTNTIEAHSDLEVIVICQECNKIIEKKPYALEQKSVFVELLYELFGPEVINFVKGGIILQAIIYIIALVAFVVLFVNFFVDMGRSKKKKQLK